MSSEEIFFDHFLKQRGIENIPAFLDPDFSVAVHSPWNLPGIDTAVERIIKAIKHQQQITIFGDYDADGVPATALLIRVLRRLGVAPKGIIPKRVEGYGLTKAAIKHITEVGTDLLITVDNGTVSREEIAELAALGIDTIVCDHHEPQSGHCADAVAIINPKLPESTYPFKELCACALAWKLSWALYEKLNKPTATLKWELDLVALATVADMVPLVGENRVLVQFGLKVLRKTRNQGLKVLAEVAGGSLAEAGTEDIGFRLAPRLNAPSRMHQEIFEDQNAALSLLLSKNPTAIAQFLHQTNAKRQALVDEHLKEANLQAANMPEALCLVVYDKSWSTGVIGLVAGRLMESYKRPVIALAPEGGIIKGSVRSLGDISVLDLLGSVADQCERFGGHSKAGGLTLKGSDISRLQEGLNNWLTQQGVALASLAKAAYRIPDIALSLSEASIRLAELIQTAAPYGIGFPEPLLASKVQVRSPRLVGAGGNHFSCLLVDGSEQRKAIGFGMGEQQVLPDAWYNAEYTLQVETWRGVARPSCMLHRLVLI